MFPDFRKFWEPGDFRGQCIKWVFILLPLLLSIYIFLHMLQPILAYEQACEHPVIVEAQTELVPVLTTFSGTTHYEIRLSYEYDGNFYSGIYYRYSKSPAALWSTEETVTVALNPAQPEVLLKFMLSRTPIDIAFLLWCLGSTLLSYAIALEIPGFRRWRIRAANKPDLLTRPYGKPKPEVFSPDYSKDILLLLIPFSIVTMLSLSLIFPHTFLP